MRIRLIAVGNKVPVWIKQGLQTYTKRFSPAYSFELIEIPHARNSAHTNAASSLQKEGLKLAALLKSMNYSIALDVKGKLYSTDTFTALLKRLQSQGTGLDLFIGGPDGISPSFLQRVNERWSLSPLTFPHTLTRVLVVEQIYRAISILRSHPYHRA